MTENEFLGWILDLAARFGWRAYHVPMPVRPVGGGRFIPESRAKGLPDLILLHDDPPRLIFAEVKGPKGKLTAEQQLFLRLARDVGTEAFDSDGRRLVAAYSWRPGVESLIETVLRGKALA